MHEIPMRIQPTKLAKQELVAREKGIEVVRRLEKQLSRGGCMDEFLADQVVLFMALAVGGIEPGDAETNSEGADEGNGMEGREVNGAEGRGMTGTGGVVDGDGDGLERCEILVGKVSLHCETAMRIAEIMVPTIQFTTENRPEGEVMICQRKPAEQ
jgi:RNA 3'-terminal phosphate cyclase